MENGLHIGAQTYGWGFMTRPITLIIVVLIVLTLFAAWRRARKDRDIVDKKVVGDGADVENPAFALPFDILLFAVFVVATAMALFWPTPARFMPLVATIPAMLFMAVILWRDSKALHARKAIETHAISGEMTERTAALKRGGMFYIWMLGVVGATLVIGQYLALLGFVALYLRFWGKVGWGLISAYTLISGLMLYLLFNVVVPVLWYESPFFSLFN